MKESMRDYFKPGLIHFMAYPTTMKGDGPIEETVKKILTDTYFDAIEVTQINDASVRAKVADMIGASCVTAAFGGQPMLLAAGKNVNDTDEGRRAEAVALLKMGIDQAYELGCVAFAFLSGKYDSREKDKAYGALIKSTKELCAYAKQKGGMTVAHEVFDYDVDKKSLIGPAGLAKEYAQEISACCDNFGLMVDLSHIPLLHETIEESLLPVKDYIIHAHMGNCVSKDSSMPGYGDSHPRFGFPYGDNDVDELAHYLKVLMDIGFICPEKRPIVSFEVKPFGDEDSEIVIANAKRTLDAAWRKI